MKSCRVSGAGLSQVAALVVFGGVVLPEHQGEAMRPEQRAGTRGLTPQGRGKPGRQGWGVGVWEIS